MLAARGVGGALTLGLAGVLAACSGGTPAVVTAPLTQPSTAAATTPSSTTSTSTSSTTTTTTAPTTTTTAVPAIPINAGQVAAGAEWTLLAVGDVLMDDTEAAGVGPFGAVVPSLASGTLAVVNVEMVIATSGVAVDKTYTFRAPPSAAGRLAGAGVDVANLGNNHTLDFGENALMETISHLRAAGVATVGAGANADEAFAPVTGTVGGVRVAVLGTTRIVPRRDWAADGGPGIASAFLERRLLAAVRAAKASADVVIVNVHWGQEGSPCPEPAQEQLGAALLDAGASVVIGSHPHVLQPIVADGRGVLAYSLGNFAFHRRHGAQGESGVLEVRFAGAQITGHRLHPHVLDHGPPRPAGPEAAARIAAAVANPCLPPPTTTTVPPLPSSTP
ncbi:MAG: CapA family protein [Acidimicrobiales bacterium]